MTNEQRYLFDLKGYLTVRGALPADLVQALNVELDLIDAMSTEAANAAGAIRQTRGDRDPYGNLEYTSHLLPYGGIFESLIDVPATVPLIEEMIGGPTRLDAMHFMSRTSGRGSVLHHGYAELLAYSEYALNRDRFECVSVKIGYALTDVGPDNGPFVVMPGSHKSNFATPGHLRLPDAADPLVEPITVQAGDAVLFSEDLTHGALVNRSDRVRRTIFISYAPAFHAAWNDQTVTAPGFEERATPRQLELVRGPAPYGAQTTYSQEPVPVS
ncbi:MAG: phytanoyl-CoA dioxygenase family protein [Spirochaetaceae bacterium]|nr:phytanoyl-CoA dioxygenase family protein [Spirochaetaceae bacterium]